MENTLLVGLSRQMVLERQMDVVANNVANVNTTGYKADKSLFEEYLKTGAHEDNFVGLDRRVSYVQDGGIFKDFTQGPTEQTKNPLDVAIDGAGFLEVQTPAGLRYTRDGGLQINNQGQLVTAAGNPVIGNNGPLAVQAILRTIRETEGMPENEAFKPDTQIGISVFLSDDAKEGPKAFAEKRTPQFKGR